jgi:hypothetical protein
MHYLITIKKLGGASETYHAIGNRDALMDAAYDHPGALGVSVMVQP